MFKSGASIFSTAKKIIAKNAVQMYRFMAMFTVFVMMIFAIPSFLFGSEKDNADTKIGVDNRIKIGNLQLTQIKRGFNPKNNYGEIFLKLEGRFPDGGELKMVSTEAKTEETVEYNLIKLTEDYYLIQLIDIPEKWRTVVIDIGVVSPNSPELKAKSLDDVFAEYGKKKDPEEELTEQDTIFFGRKGVPEDQGATKTNKNKYLEECLSLQQEESRSLIKENNQLIVESKELIKGLEKDIKQLEDRKQYETKSEIVKTDSEIANKKSKIYSYQAKIEQAEDNNEELLEKIEKIKQQISDGV